MNTATEGIVLSGVVAAGFFGLGGEALIEKGREDVYFVANVDKLLVLQKPSEREKN